jgi:hypothetical protein
MELIVKYEHNKRTRNFKKSHKKRLFLLSIKYKKKLSSHRLRLNARKKYLESVNKPKKLLL